MKALARTFSFVMLTMAATVMVNQPVFAASGKQTLNVVGKAIGKFLTGSIPIFPGKVRLGIIPVMTNGNGHKLIGIASYAQGPKTHAYGLLSWGEHFSLGLVSISNRLSIGALGAGSSKVAISPLIGIGHDVGIGGLYGGGGGFDEGQTKAERDTYKQIGIGLIAAGGKSAFSPIVAWGDKKAAALGWAATGYSKPGTSGVNVWDSVPVKGDWSRSLLLATGSKANVSLGSGILST